MMAYASILLLLLHISPFSRPTSISLRNTGRVVKVILPLQSMTSIRKQHTTTYRPERGSSIKERPQESQTYTDIHHNDNPFDLMFLLKEAKVCKSCDTDFCHRTKIIPFDLFFGHKECWHYPVNGDWANRKATTKETMRYYYTTKICILQRFPYFNWDFVAVSQSVAVSLSESHKQYLKSEFHNVVF